MKEATDGRNMVGLTNEEAVKEAERQKVVCLVASAYALAMLTLAAGWLVYWACGLWPALGMALPPAGFMAMGWASCMAWREVMKVR